MIKRVSEKVAVAAMQEQARGDLANHQIRKRRDGHWVCYRRNGESWSGSYWFEAIVTHGGDLIITGDLDLVCFSSHGRYDDPVEVVRWMGKSNDLAWYVSQKARIGTGQEPMRDRDEGVWVDDALTYMEHNHPEVQVDDPSRFDELPTWLSGLLQEVFVYEADPFEATADLLSEGDEGAHESGADQWGLIPSCRLVYAHEAARKLASLLDAEGDHG
jgi:hypothetical protein